MRKPELDGLQLFGAWWISAALNLPALDSPFVYNQAVRLMLISFPPMQGQLNRIEVYNLTTQTPVQNVQFSDSTSLGLLEPSGDITKLKASWLKKNGLTLDQPRQIVLPLDVQHQSPSSDFYVVRAFDPSETLLLSLPLMTTWQPEKALAHISNGSKFLKDINFISEPVKGYGYIESFPTGATPFSLSKSVPRGTTPFSLSKSQSLNVNGWAILPDSRELPNTVLLSYGSNRTFFASAVVNLDSPDVAKVMKSSQHSNVRWSVNISPKFLPLGETVIKAWVYDPFNKQLIKLSGELKLEVVE